MTLNNNEHNIWKQYFDGRFDKDSMLEGTIWCGDNIVTSDAGDDVADMADMTELVKALNGGKFDHAVFKNAKYNDAVISYVDKNGKTILLDIRGWGYLTGYLKLSDDAAVVVQDALGEYIVSCMKKVNDNV